MLAGAALVPDTALLVPGAAGRADVLTAERAAAARAVRALLDARPERVVVVAPAAPVARVAQVTQDAQVAQVAVGAAVPRSAPVEVARYLLHDAGWPAGVDVVAAGGEDPAALARLGHGLAHGTDRTALLLVGSLSARRGPDGPLPTDDRAPGLEDAVLADLVDAGPEALARLADVPARLAADLAVSAWGPWQVLAGARPGPGTLVHRAAPFGATYVVVTWTAVVDADAAAGVRP